MRRPEDDSPDPEVGRALAVIDATLAGDAVEPEDAELAELTLILAGVGVSMAMPAAQNAILSSVAITEMGKASGVFNMSRFLGGMFGVALLVAVFSAHGAADTPAHFASGFAAAMMAAATLSAFAAIAGAFLPTRRAVAQLKPQQA